MRKFALGIVGLSPGNGHPYSWSAIFNGYDPVEMAKCPFPVIPEYLARQDPVTMRLEGAGVTHIWTQDRSVSEAVAKAGRIEHVVDRLEDLIGRVDAVLLARDDPENHLSMARPFIEAGIPILIDKPLTNRLEDLRRFVSYYQAGKLIMSCSSARYAASTLSVKEKSAELGRILTAVAVTPKYWRTYGIHAIEGIYAIMGGGIESAQNVGRPDEDIVHLKYRDGRHAVIQAFAKIKSGGTIFYGEQGSASIGDPDAFFQFKNMLRHFLLMLETGSPQFDWRGTAEMMQTLIAGQMSLAEGGRPVRLDEIAAEPE